MRGQGERRAVARFAMAGVAAMLVVAVLLALLLDRSSRAEAISDARQLTQVTAQGIIQPALSDGVTTGEPSALAILDGVVRTRVLGGPVARVKIWAADGTIVYSDEGRLIGSRFQLGADERAALATGQVDAELSDLARPENRYEPRGTQLLEVYLPVTTPGGRRLLYENYLRLDSVTARGNRILLAFLPAFLAGLVLLELVQLPLAVSLARKVSESRREREQLLQRALEASDLERRRIARDLHDGCVQDLAGVALSLASEARRLETVNEAAAGTVGAAAGAARRAIGQLRRLLVDIYPPHVAEAGLATALTDLLTPLAAKGLATSVSVPHGLALSLETETLIYRVAQEAVRNVAAHSGARSVQVSVTRARDAVRLAVDDDGRGFDEQVLEGSRREGHLGLRLLADLARDAGGRLAVDSGPGRGTHLRLEAPA